MSDWNMKGLNWDDPRRLKSPAELEAWVEEVGFAPYFAGDIPGFSAEEMVSPDYWWTGDAAQDPWEWREAIAGAHRVAYGKFFDGRAGFISRAWLPCFANARRDGYNFDGRWQSGAASRREKAIMERFMDVESEDEPVFTDAAILSTQLKKDAGFGKGGEKNYPGVLTGLQMQLYLVIAGFRRRENKRGAAYGMPVSVLMTPESLWGYETLSAAYCEDPADSWQRIFDRVKERFPAPDADIVRLIGRRPAP